MKVNQGQRNLDHRILNPPPEFRYPLNLGLTLGSARILIELLVLVLGQRQARQPGDFYLGLKIYTVKIFGENSL